MSVTYRHDPAFLKAVETLIQTIQFDVNGTAGKGGNGGLTSDKAIRQSGELNIMMDRIKKQEAETSAPPVAVMNDQNIMNMVSAYGRNPNQQLFDQIYHQYLLDCESVAISVPAQDFCPICIKAFRLGDILCPRPNGPGPVHAECLKSKPDVDQETGEVIRDTLPTFIYEGHRSLVTTQGDAPETCPICQEAFKLSDLCATDITMGTCHAECLDGSPVVDLDTGEETGGEVHLYHYIIDAPPAPLPQNFIATHRHKARGSSYQLIGGATIQTAGKLADMDAVVIYRNEDGTLWARSPSEFFDGRFDEVA